MDPITLALLAGGAYLATRKTAPTAPAPPTPSGGGDAVKPNDSGPAAPLPVKTESGNKSPERVQAAQKKANAKIAKALKTSSFGNLTLAELNQINPNRLRNEAEKQRFLLVKRRAAAQAKK